MLLRCGLMLCSCHKRFTVFLLTPCASAINRQLQMGHAGRLTLQSGLYDSVLLGLIVTGLTSSARRYPPHLANPPLVYSLAPQLHGSPGSLQAPRPMPHCPDPPTLPK